ncbi:MAG: hypothetical protein JEZ02_12565 [Desulfatibacillum sp.]|nr:hypothetical protein [Desulfatibacillum sp.]
MDGTICLILNEDEALVLFDWVTRFNEKGLSEFEGQTEERVLWDIEAALEKSLAAPFKENYLKLPVDARRRVRDQVE